ncbi:hypothetical protein CC86DRAFT_400638 [Ophiobolus disseminans]|uniref:Uncharacterized protein n=1 Tax=Ophiobolus disseminans TaxID=1469910 RepID=A0A6A7AGZ0_9PLEO|nr:hypothetical protein CC86DRAFT_400638 [Ophiobolus disseminans]
MPTTFFDLFRELRDEIYHHAWTNTRAILFRNGPNLSMGAWYDGDPCIIVKTKAYTFKVPDWLRTSKIMLREGIEAFHRKGLITMYPSLDTHTYDLQTRLSPLEAR